MLSLDFIKGIKEFSRRIELIDYFEYTEQPYYEDCDDYPEDPYYWLRCNPAAGHLDRLSKGYFTDDYNKRLEEYNYEFYKDSGLLEKNLDKVDWERLSQNPAAIYLLEKNLDKLNWEYLSKNPAALGLLEKNKNKINWSNLAINPAALDLIEKNRHNIRCYSWLYQNPSCINLIEK